MRSIAITIFCGLQSKLMKTQAQDFRRTRQKQTVELRKQNREQIFLKKRQTETKISMNAEQQTGNKKSYIVDERYREAIQQFINEKYYPEQLNNLCQGLVNADKMVQHQAAIGLRLVISNNHQNEELLQRIVDNGAVPLLINLMKQPEYPQLQLEACWVVTNVASGSTANCQSIIDKNGLDVFLKLIIDNKPGINQQAVWGIGNIAGDCPKFRDMVLSKGGLLVLIKVIQNTTNKSLISNGAWAISNLCRGTPAPKFQWIKSAIPVLAKIIMCGVLVEDILSDSLWALSNNSEGQKSRIQKIVQIPSFVAKLCSICLQNIANLKIIVPCLRIIGNISTGNQLHTQQILKSEGLSLLLRMLDHEKKTIRRQSCWIISNICAGTASQISQILVRHDLLLKLSILFAQDALDVRKEICYIFANIAQLGDPNTVFQTYVKCHVLEEYVVLIMQNEDVKCIEFALHGLYQALEIGRRLGGSENLVYRSLELVPNFFERLQSLQQHNSKQIYNKVVKIFKTFFVLEDQSL